MYKAISHNFVDVVVDAKKQFVSTYVKDKQVAETLTTLLNFEALTAKAVGDLAIDSFTMVYTNASKVAK